MNAWEPYRQLVSELDTREYNPLTDRRLWLIASVTALLVYGTELTSFSLSIDEELHGYQGRAVWETWLGQGRWGMAILTYVLPPLAALPFLPTLIFCSGLVAGAILFAGQLVASRREAFAFVAMFVSCPTWPHIGEFNTFSWGVGIALCSCALALWFGRMGGLGGAAYSGALLAFSISIYQSFLLLYAVAALLHYVLAESGRVVNRRSLTGVFGGCLAGITFYYFILKGSLFLTGTELSYVQHWIKISELLGVLDTGRQRAIESVSGLVLGGHPIYLGWGIVALLLPWIGLFAVSWRLAASRSTPASVRLVLATAFVGSIAAVLSPVVISAGRIPVRALVAFPLLYAALSSVPFPNRFRPWRNIGLFSLLSFTVLVNAWIATSLFYSDTIARDRDAILATRLIHRIEEVGRPKFGASIPIAVAGAWAHSPGGPYHRVEIFGTSFFEHGGGSAGRIVPYLRLMSLTGARPVQLASIPKSIETIQQMPAWPAPESVAVIDEVVVVKFGDLTYQQQISLPQ